MELAHIDPDRLIEWAGSSMPLLCRIENKQGFDFNKFMVFKDHMSP